MHADASDTNLERAARATRSWGGQEAKVIRGGDGRVRALNPLNGNRIGVVISEEDADLLERMRTDRDNAIPPLRGILMACAMGLLVAVILVYGGFHVGRSYQRGLDESPRFTR